MFNSIGPLKSVDLVNAIGYRIDNLRDKLVKAADSSTESVNLPAISQEIVDAYKVRAAIKNNAVYVAIEVEGVELPNAIESPKADLLTPSLVAIAEKLVNRYVCNYGTDQEFIACVTPERDTIGQGGVWDDWLMLKVLVDQSTGRRSGGKS